MIDQFETAEKIYADVIQEAVDNGTIDAEDADQAWHYLYQIRRMLE